MTDHWRKDPTTQQTQLWRTYDFDSVKVSTMLGRISDEYDCPMVRHALLRRVVGR